MKAILLRVIGESPVLDAAVFALVVGLVIGLTYKIVKDGIGMVRRVRQ